MASYFVETPKTQPHATEVRDAEPIDLCQEVLAQNRRKRAVSTLGATCVSYKGGAWAVALHDAGGEGYVSWQGEHLRARDGNVIEEPVGEAVVDIPGIAETSGVWIQDLDGDGAPEFAFDHWRRGPEGGEARELSAYSWGDSGPRKATLPFGIVGLEDIDGDAYADGVIALHASVRLMCPGASPDNRYPEIETPGFFLHYAPERGRFELDHPLTRGSARKRCPARPTGAIVATMENGATYIDENKTADTILCARVWGQPVDQVEAAIRASCLRAPSECHDEPLANTCDFRDALLQWAASVPSIF